MTVGELKEALNHFPDDTIVIAYNGDDEELVEVTGLLFEFNKLIKKHTLEICTDNNS